MSVPLHQLYKYIRQIVCSLQTDNVIIYRFFPDGSKNLQDLSPLSANRSHDWFSHQTSHNVWCHDQEPLNYDFYSDLIRESKKRPWHQLRQSLPGNVPTYNINYAFGVFDKAILCHSEMRSNNLLKYLQYDPTKRNSQLISVYYWCHALISRDWFRHAEHEYFKKNIQKLFLIYNRAWSGTREYRLKFTDLLIEHNLVDKCLTFCSPEENGLHYSNHQFINSIWRPNHVLENHVGSTTADSMYSAVYNADDYNQTEIEIVLETLFDDDRLHLTEKSLRPIACGQPFILAATHGSLQYLRDYGFKTFDCVWSENYDTIEDPAKRMLAIIEVMRDISSWSDAQRTVNNIKITQIVNYNRQHFFSKKFFETVIGELQSNLSHAFHLIRAEPGFEKWVQSWQELLKFPQVNEFLDTNTDLTMPSRQQYMDALAYIQHYEQKII